MMDKSMVFILNFEFKYGFGLVLEIICLFNINNK